MNENVYLFVPNLIGYLRVITLGIAMYNCFTSATTFFFFYGISQLLDAFDGFAARALNQATKYGAVLDMVTDRASTAILAIALARLCESEYVVLGLMTMIGIDIMSHYARLYSTLSSGLASHKDVSSATNPLLRIYYNSRVVLFTLCMGQEAFLDLLYLSKMLEKEKNPLIDVDIVRIAMWINFPLFLMKQLMNVIQLMQSMKEVATIDANLRKNLTKKK